MNPSSLCFFSALLVASIIAVMVTAFYADFGDDDELTNALNYSLISSGMEEMSTVPYVMNFKGCTFSSIPKDAEDDIEKQIVPSISCTSNSHEVEKAYSIVTLTFGTDKPEVYMNMKPNVEGRPSTCKCPCNHEDSLFSNPGHISLTSTISSTSPGNSASPREEVRQTEQSPRSFVPEKLAAAAEGAIKMSFEEICVSEEETEILVDTCMAVANPNAALKRVSSMNDAIGVDRIRPGDRRMTISEKVLGCTNVTLIYQWAVFNMFVHMWSMFKTIFDDEPKPQKRRQIEI